MKINRVDAIPVTIPTNAFSSAFRKFGPMRKVSFVVVRIRTDDGLIGNAEGVGRAGFFGQPVESVKFAIDKYLSPRIIGLDPFDLERILSTMDMTIVGNSCAKAGIEIALYDLMGKALKMPVYQLTGGRYRDKILVGIEVGIASPDEMAKKAIEYVEKGIRVLKVKVGVEPSEDIERIRAVRDAVGSDITLRTDVNEGWTSLQAIKTVKKLERYDLELVEQPAPRWDVQGLARVRKAASMPIEADESVYSPTDALNLIVNEAVDMMNIKVTKAGGLYNAKKIAAIAEAAGVPCLVGTEFNLGLGVAAKLHLAASTKNISHACEFTECYIMSDSLLVTPLEIKDGCLDVPEKAGLGVELDERKLQKFSVADVEHADFDEY
jgi:L-alanine-DL-glutamate epimerase-like enolase superfamily enzyme